MALTSPEDRAVFKSSKLLRSGSRLPETAHHQGSSQNSRFVQFSISDGEIAVGEDAGEVDASRGAAMVESRDAAKIRPVETGHIVKMCLIKAGVIEKAGLFEAGGSAKRRSTEPAEATENRVIAADILFEHGAGEVAAAEVLVGKVEWFTYHAMAEIGEVTKSRWFAQPPQDLEGGAFATRHNGTCQAS